MSHQIFALPDLEAYVHGVKFKSKLRKWSKSQGFKECSPVNLKEWCTDSFVLDSLLKFNKYKSSPIDSPLSPLTPETPSLARKLPPCRGNLLDDYKQSNVVKGKDQTDFEKNARTGALGIGRQPTKIKRIWNKMTRHKEETSANSVRGDTSFRHSREPTKRDATNLFYPSKINPHKGGSFQYDGKCHGSTNVLRLLELI